MIKIDELVMRIPGITAEEGDLLGRNVAERVANGMPAQTENINISSLEIRLDEKLLQDKTRMASSISEQIISKIKQAAFLTR